MVGATLMAFLGALHYWFPKMFGRTYSEGWGLVSAALIILGFNATFIPQFLLGNAGMPRRYWSYPAEFQALNVASTAGASLLAFGFVIILIYTTIALFYGEKVGRNPWGSRGYEWNSPSPPPKHNFDSPQVFDHPPHDYDSEGSEAEMQTEVHGGKELHGDKDGNSHG
jgi:cytochrome c oxidase subunit 1